MKSTFQLDLKGRVAVFIDAANVLYSQKDMGWEIDYKKLMAYLKSSGNIVYVGFYYGVIESNLGQKRFFKMLVDRGYTLRTKPVKFIKTKQGIERKGNLDVELAFDIWQWKEKFDTCVLMSGDSDFEVVLDDLERSGKTILVFSARGHVARELIKLANKYVPFERIRGEVERKNHPAEAGDVYSGKIVSSLSRKVKRNGQSK